MVRRRLVEFRPARSQKFVTGFTPDILATFLVVTVLDVNALIIRH